MANFVRILVLIIAIAILSAGCSTELAPQDGSSTSSSDELTTTSLRTDTGGASNDPSTSSTVETTTTTQPDGPFLLDDSGLFKDGSADWNDAFVVPGPVVKADGVFYMFYTGHTWEGAGVDRGHVGYITSPEGLDWSFGDEVPLFDAADLDWAGGAIYPSTAIITDDGTWVVWFSTVLQPFAERGKYIGRATAPGPDGPWSVDPDPVLGPGGEGTWFENGVMHASVVEVADGWRMYFDGYIDDLDSAMDRSIGMAMSTDVTTWEFYDDPTTDGIYADSDPVFTSGQAGAWDGFRVRSPSVVATDGGFVMTYLSSWRLETPGFRSDFGFATSDDGIDWLRAEQNPLIENDGTYGFITDGTASRIDDDIVLYFDGAASVTAPSSTIYHLTAPLADLR